MDITLKQTEITSAIRGYLTDQGFSLEGKALDVKYTSGRGPNGGVSAQVSISDALIPGFDTDRSTTEDQPKADVVQLTAPVAPTTVTAADTSVQAEEKPEHDAALDTGIPAPVKPATTSLFVN